MHYSTPVVFLYVVCRRLGNWTKPPQVSSCSTAILHARQIQLSRKWKWACNTERTRKQSRPHCSRQKFILFLEGSSSLLWASKIIFHRSTLYCTLPNPLQLTVTEYLHSCPVFQNHPTTFKSGKVQQLPLRLRGLCSVFVRLNMQVERFLWHQTDLYWPGPKRWKQRNSTPCLQSTYSENEFAGKLASLWQRQAVTFFFFFKPSRQILNCWAWGTAIRLFWSDMAQHCNKPTIVKRRSRTVQWHHLRLN